jgi:hypothetical protein
MHAVSEKHFRQVLYAAKRSNSSPKVAILCPLQGLTVTSDSPQGLGADHRRRMRHFRTGRREGHQIKWRRAPRLDAARSVRGVDLLRVRAQHDAARIAIEISDLPLETLGQGDVIRAT